MLVAILFAYFCIALIVFMWTYMSTDVDRPADLCLSYALFWFLWMFYVAFMASVRRVKQG